MLLYTWFDHSILLSLFNIGVTYTHFDLKTFKAQTFLNLPIVNKWRWIYCCEQWNIPTSKRSKKTQTQSQTQNVLALNLIIYGIIFTTKAKIVTNQRSDDETWPERWCYLILSCWTINLLIFRFVLVWMISIQRNRPLILSHSIHQLFHILCVCVCALKINVEVAISMNFWPSNCWTRKF